VVPLFLTAVSLGVAAIPEALPAVVSGALALGARRMSRQRALVRNLPAGETLGSVTYMCADKTGTLTENRMSVQHYFIEGQLLDGMPDTAVDMARALALSNDIEACDEEAKGEPTELALYQAAKNHGYDKLALAQQYPRIDELPFDSERKRMSTMHREDAGTRLYCKGAPETLLPLCVDIDQQLVSDKSNELATQGYRVLAVATRRLPAVSGQAMPAEAVESDLSFLGLVALIDPPRKAVPQAVRDCVSAGIQPVMITGDHPATAMAIAKELGLASCDKQLMVGNDLDRLAPAALERRVREWRVYRRGARQNKRVVT